MGQRGVCSTGLRVVTRSYAGGSGTPLRRACITRATISAPASITATLPCFPPRPLLQQPQGSFKGINAGGHPGIPGPQPGNPSVVGRRPWETSLLLPQPECPAGALTCPLPAIQAPRPHSAPSLGLPVTSEAWASSRRRPRPSRHCTINNLEFPVCLYWRLLYPPARGSLNSPHVAPSRCSHERCRVGPARTRAPWPPGGWWRLARLCTGEGAHVSKGWHAPRSPGSNRSPDGSTA